MIAAKSSVAAHAVENVSAGPESRVQSPSASCTSTRVQRLDTEVTPREPPIPPSQRMLNVMTEAGELASTIRTGLSDGILDEDEKVAVCREIEHLRTQLDGLERDIRRS